MKNNKCTIYRLKWFYLILLDWNCIYMKWNALSTERCDRWNFSYTWIPKINQISQLQLFMYNLFIRRQIHSMNGYFFNDELIIKGQICAVLWFKIKNCTIILCNNNIWRCFFTWAYARMCRYSWTSRESAFYYTFLVL